MPARIRGCVARPGLVKCGWSKAWERAHRATDLALRNPEPPIRRRSANRLLNEVKTYYEASAKDGGRFIITIYSSFGPLNFEKSIVDMVSVISYLGTFVKTISNGSESLIPNSKRVIPFVNSISPISSFAIIM